MKTSKKVKKRRQQEQTIQLRTDQQSEVTMSSVAYSKTVDSKPCEVGSSDKQEASQLVPVAEFDDNAMAPLSRDAGAVVRWEWCSDNLVWAPYLPSLSAIIEAAFQSGKSEVNVHVGHSSYTVSFRSMGPRQKNLATGRTRPVKRHATEQGTGVSWLWWESETQRWHAYDVALAAQIEDSWKECNSSKTFRKEHVCAGLFFNIHQFFYALEYEIDAVQYNANTQYARGVRRCSCLPQGNGLSFEGQATTIGDMKHCSPATSQSSNSLTISPCLDNACYQAQPQPADIGSCSPSSWQSLNSQTMLPCLNNTSDKPYPQSRANILGSDVRDGMLERPSYNSADLVDYLSSSDTEDCSICLCSLQEKRSVTLLKCEHSFHRGCIEAWFQSRPRCPECLTVYGTIIGTQPPGEMHIDYIEYGSKRVNSRLAGYANVDVIKITYRFPSGIQTAEHPNPGRPYAGTVRIAYLPRNRDGEEVLELLKKAWKQRLLFCVGTSVTTGQSDVVIWSGIHHKTRTSGGSSNHGYPDENYFSRVKKELEDSGVQLVVTERVQYGAK